MINRYNKQLNALIQASLLSHFALSDYNTTPFELVNVLRGLFLNDDSIGKEEVSDEDPISVMEGALDVEGVMLPKGIYVRSNEYLNMISQVGAITDYSLLWLLMWATAMGLLFRLLSFRFGVVMSCAEKSVRLWLGYFAGNGRVSFDWSRYTGSDWLEEVKEKSEKEKQRRNSMQKIRIPTSSSFEKQASQ